MTEDQSPPIQHFYDLSDLSEAGDEVSVNASADDLPRLAAWLDIQAVECFAAKVTLSRVGQNRFRYDAVLTADLVQSCVVSLEPVPSHHELHIGRVLHVRGRQPRRWAPEEEKGGVLTLSAADDDAPEELDSSHYDLAIPLLEELSLDLDPYPRADGVEFEVPKDQIPEDENPFAALKRLKLGGS